VLSHYMAILPHHGKGPPLNLKGATDFKMGQHPKPATPRFKSGDSAGKPASTQQWVLARFPVSGPF
jgi:hypothetical protein